MNDKGVSCTQNFPIWVAFLMGMVVIVIAIALFDNLAARGRLGGDTAVKATLNDGNVSYQGTTPPTYGETVSYAKDADNALGAWLGIEVEDITKAMAKELGLRISGGVLVSRVIENSPAEQAKLLRGDIIYEFDRHDVEDIGELAELLSKADPGDRVRLSLFRDGKRMVSYVKLGEAFGSVSTSSVMQTAGEVISSNQKWGIVVSELTDSLRRDYAIPIMEKGVLVVMVMQGSAADKAGLRKGDLIKQVDRIRIENVADFFEAVRSADNSTLLNVYRQGAELYVNIVAVSPFQPVAQEGIGMNRPLYVPGYDQTQSGEPDEKTGSLSGSDLKVPGSVAQI